MTDPSTAPRGDATATPVAGLPPAPASPPLTAQDIPPGWELETQRLRRIHTAPAQVVVPTPKPTAPVVSAGAGAGLGACIVWALNEFGHPVPTEAAIAITTIVSTLAGFIHPRGRT